MQKLLIDAVTATDATKIEFSLSQENFKGSSVPSLKSRGLGTGDSVKVFEWINNDWQETFTGLTDTVNSITIAALGTYAVDITMATIGPVSVVIEASGRV